MIEYSKNGNEYLVDGKRYVKGIRRCRVDRLEQGTYTLWCHITERGDKPYCYLPDEERIVYASKGFYLSEGAADTVHRAIAKFHEGVDAAVENATEITVEGMPAGTFVYKRESKKLYTLVRREMIDGKPTVLLYPKYSAGEMLCCVRELNDTPLEQHPVYLTAMKGDELLRRQLLFCFGPATAEDSRWLSEQMGYDILPPVSKEHDIDYVVDNMDIDRTLLEHSGYDLLHRPYFAMMHSTHEMVTINPYRRVLVDAANVDAIPISFGEFMRKVYGQDV